MTPAAPCPALPIPYAEIIRLLNFTYRDTRWHSASVANPESSHIASVEQGPVRIDFFTAGELVIAMPRPTDWVKLSSILPNICLSKDCSVGGVVEKACGQLADPICAYSQLVLIGFSQAGHIAMRLGAALLEKGVKNGAAVSVVTFNSAPLEDDQKASRKLDDITVNYRAVIGGTPANRLGYSVGDYISMLGPLPGLTFEVEMQDIGPALPKEKKDALSYIGLHADPYLIPEDQGRWRVKDVSAAARNNPGLSISGHLRAGWKDICGPREVIGIVGRALVADSNSVNIGTVTLAQIENLVGFARIKPSSLRWKLVKRLAHLTLTRSGAAVLSFGKQMVGYALIAISEVMVLLRPARRH